MVKRRWRQKRSTTLTKAAMLCAGLTFPLVACQSPGFDLVSPADRFLEHRIERSAVDEATEPSLERPDQPVSVMPRFLEAAVREPGTGLGQVAQVDGETRWIWITFIPTVIVLAVLWLS